MRKQMDFTSRRIEFRPEIEQIIQWGRVRARPQDPDQKRLGFTGIESVSDK